MRDDRRTLASLLLVVQAGLALLAAVGLLVFARLSNAVGALAGAEALAFGGPFILLLCAVGVAKNWRVARPGVYTREWASPPSWSSWQPSAWSSGRAAPA